jgi:hypothetical protein
MENKVLGNIRDLTVVIAAYLVFTGWVFNYYYFKSMGINSKEVSFEYQSLLIYSFNVFNYSRWISLLVFVILFGIFYFNKRDWIKYAACVVIFPVLFYMSKKSGESYSSSFIRDGGNNVYVMFAQEFIQEVKDTVVKQPNEFKGLLTYNREGKLRIAAVANDKIFLIYTGGVDEVGGIYAVKREFIKSYIIRNKNIHYDH